MDDTIINAALTAEIERLNSEIDGIRAHSAQLFALNTHSLSLVQSVLQMIRAE